MYIEITEEKKPIFVEQLTSFSTIPITFVVYQFHSKTFFSQSIYNRVQSAYLDGDNDHEISRKNWTQEMIAHAKMRENTVPREARVVHYSIFGKALFTFLFVLILALGYMAVRSVSEMKKERAQEASLNRKKP
jgi:hypothetical protein